MLNPGSKLFTVIRQIEFDRLSQVAMLEGVFRVFGGARLLRIFLISFLISAPALADPWLRDEGAAFLSFGIEETEDRLTNQTRTLGTVLFESGLTDRLTFGLDLSGTDGDDWTALTYLRQPLGDRTGAGRASVTFGLGLERDPLRFPSGRSEPVFLVGGALGRGFDSSLGDGWVSIDTEVRFRPESDEEDLKTDLTLGLNATQRLAVVGQVQLGQYAGNDTSARLSASLVGRLSPGIRAELGLLYGIDNDDTRGLKVGTWLDF